MSLSTPLDGLLWRKPSPKTIPFIISFKVTFFWTFFGCIFVGDFTVTVSWCNTGQYCHLNFTLYLFLWQLAPHNREVAALDSTVWLSSCMSTTTRLNDRCSKVISGYAAVPVFNWWLVAFTPMLQPRCYRRLELLGDVARFKRRSCTTICPVIFSISSRRIEHRLLISTVCQW